MTPLDWIALCALGVQMPIPFLLVVFREPLLAGPDPPVWAAALGALLIFGDVALLVYLHHVFSGPRLYGHAELAASPELFTAGIYGRVRHPRYAGMMAAVAGACLLGWTPHVAVVGAVWLAPTLVAIRLEELELEARFGDAYREYARRVPRFLPRPGRSAKKSG